MCAVDQRRLAVALEREEAGFEVEDQGELRRFPPFLDPVFGHRADVIGAMALAE